MKKLYGICFMAALANNFLSLSITGIIPIYSGALHQSAVPHLMLTFIALVVLVVHYKLQTFFTLILAVATIIGLLGTYWWALKGWPGGDDGPGLAWAYVIGPISVFESFVCVPILFFLYYHGVRQKPKRFLER